jgi:hypothetical protein
MTISPNKWELDVQGYLNVCNISAATPRQQIRDFAKGVNDLGLWNSMVCWPLRSSQNYGSGDTVFSLGGLGTFNGTRVNGPTWGADGLTVDATNERVTTAFNFATAIPSILSVFSPASAAATDWRYMSNDEANTGNGIGFDGGTANLFRALGAAFSPDAGTRNANTRTIFGLGYGTSNTFLFQDGTRTTRTNATYLASANTLCPVGNSNFGGASGEGVFSFSVAFDGVALTSATLSSFYTLYKDTLGTGLGLP